MIWSFWQTAITGLPLLACRKAAVICCSVNRDLRQALIFCPYRLPADVKIRATESRLLHVDDVCLVSVYVRSCFPDPSLEAEGGFAACLPAGEGPGPEGGLGASPMSVASWPGFSPAVMLPNALTIAGASASASAGASASASAGARADTSKAFSNGDACDTARTRSILSASVTSSTTASSARDAALGFDPGSSRSFRSASSIESRGS